MLIFIQNKPRAYAWGSTDALADMLGTEPTGEPQAELWLGAHPGDPAEIAKATPEPHTLLDLIESDPEQYGVDGAPLPFLLKVLAIGAPLSLQVHPDREQAQRGYAAEELLGLPHDARQRNYRDPNHKPEVLVALGPVRALAGFRPLEEVLQDVAALSAVVGAADRVGAEALAVVAGRLRGADAAGVRRDFIRWAFSGDSVVERAISAISTEVALSDDPARAETIAEIIRKHPGDPGVLVSLLLHHVCLQPGEAIYLPARHLHAYIGGVAIEVMAASDNVLRAGLTEKHVDIVELCEVLDTEELPDPRFPAETIASGLDAWRPPVADFVLMRARVVDSGDQSDFLHAAPLVSLPADHPLVLVVTAGRVRLERLAEEFDEVVSARRGQSLYISAGSPVQVTGHGEVFVATVGESER